MQTILPKARTLENSQSAKCQQCNHFFLLLFLLLFIIFWVSPYFISSVNKKIIEYFETQYVCIHILEPEIDHLDFLLCMWSGGVNTVLLETVFWTIPWPCSNVKYLSGLQEVIHETSLQVWRCAPQTTWSAVQWLWYLCTHAELSEPDVPKPCSVPVIV